MRGSEARRKSGLIRRENRARGELCIIISFRLILPALA